MATIPIQSTTGDPIFRSQSSSINSIRSLSRAAADASLKLNTQERIVTPGDDALSFSTSRHIRSGISALKTVSETGQLNITGLGLAVDSLEGIKGQLDNIKKLIVQSQVADEADRAGIQSEIDLSLSQIDSAAQNTKLGSRSLLNGDSTINAYRSIAANGTITDFNVNRGQSLTLNSGVTGVRVNKIGAGGATRLLSDGTNVLSVRVSIRSANKATRAAIRFSIGSGAAGTFAEYRVTGKLGSATIRVNSTGVTLTQLAGQAASFNQLAGETGVILTSSTTGGFATLTTVGFGADEFVKVELINSSALTGVAVSNASGVINPNADPKGTVLTSFGRGATATINGVNVALGGENGTTARYLQNGFDIEVDFSTFGLTSRALSSTGAFNLDLTQGVVGLLGASGNRRDTLQYGIGNFTTANLGRGNGQNTVTTESATGNAGATGGRAVTTAGRGNTVINNNSVADIGSGGSLSLGSGNISGALRTIDNAVNSVINEQTRLGTIQGNFIDAVNRAESSIGNLASAEADIIGVDAATEITNLIQSQLGISTASSVLSQANAIQATVASLLRG